MNFPYEIIISDDASTDGTWDAIQEYVRKYPGLIFGYQINSSEINPINRSERCAWNKANAFKHAKGKYFVNIDADDFLLSTDIYQLQVDALERNPDCEMCMQNIAYYQEGNPPSFLKLWHSPDRIKSNCILSPKEYILGQNTVLNQAFVIRKINNVNPAQLFGKDFDDTIITLFHLQFGNIIYLNEAQYAYVVSENSINSSLKGLDREVLMYALNLQHILLIPCFAGLFLKSGLKTIKQIMKKKISSSQLQQETKNWLAQFNGFGFHLFLYETVTFQLQIRKWIILRVSQVIDRLNLKNSFFFKLLYFLLFDTTPKNTTCLSI